VEEFAAGVGLARLDVEFERLALGIDQLDGDFFIQVAGFGDDQGGEEFLGAGDLALGGVVFFCRSLGRCSHRAEWPIWHSQKSEPMR
jgi:hypothetical protein